MKILHMIAPSARMMKTYVDCVQVAFPDDEHLFYATKSIPLGEKEFFNDENMLHMSGDNRIEKMKDVKSHCEQADIIIWHGFLYPFRMMLFLYGYRKFLKKSIWVMWGIDLYNWRIPETNPKTWFINHVNKYCRKRVAAVVALLGPDEDVYRDTISKRTPCFVAPYPIGKRSFQMMEQRRNARRRLNGKTFIQIGNNAHSFNNHNDILDKIDHLDAENVEYYFPLSYGDEKDWHGNTASYQIDLIDRARCRYEDRAHFMRKLMPQDEYTDYLWNIDIAILDADRQNALGNILKLLYMGSKVFLSPENPLYGFFKGLEINVYNSKRIAEMQKEEFYGISDGNNAVQWIYDTYYQKTQYENGLLFLTSFVLGNRLKRLRRKTGNLA